MMFSYRNLWRLLVLLSFCAGAQDYQSQYNSGKLLISESRWQAAMQVFLPLTSQAETHAYSEYSHYWYSFAAFRAKELDAAKSMLMQLLQRYPEWSKKDEAYYLLSNVYFEQLKPRLALQFMNKIKKPDQDTDNMKVKYLSEFPVTDTLIKLQKDHPQDLVLAKITALRLSNSTDPKQKMLYQFLVQEYKLDTANLLSGNTGSKKAQYRIALLLPFSLSELQTRTSKRNNQYVLDFYEGLLLALDSLRLNNDSLQLFVYDSGKEITRVQELLALPEFKSMDLIIGPVYPLQIPIVTEFGRNNQIAVVNPLSTNTRFSENNEFSWLFQPTLEYQASMAASFASQRLVHDTVVVRRGQAPLPVVKKEVLIFYGKEARDSVLAVRYRDTLVKAGLKVYRFEKIMRDKVPLMRTLLGDTAKVKMLNHIFVATSDEVLAANITSLMESSKQTTPIITRSEWLNFNLLSFDLFERLNVHFIHPEYYDFSTSEFQRFRQVYQQRVNLQPSQYSVIGYELMSFLGSSLKKNGTFWNVSFREAGLQPGKFVPGIYLGTNHCNSYVPLTRFVDKKIMLLNPVPSEE
ncbi:MAG: hypothetical protein MUF42_11815 [Cytophagaceae bacterium]|jgi:hypothetical protein|nr:hypothetical protein [Cytophagaceae bacterium]